MGKVRKLTGVQGQIDAANRAAAAEQASLQQQAANQARALAEQASSTARATAMTVAREAATARFRDAADAGQQEVDVQLDEGGSAGGTRRRRAAFGVGAGSGIRI